MNIYLKQLSKLQKQLSVNKEDQNTAKQLGLNGALLDFKNQESKLLFELELLEEKKDYLQKQ